MLKNSPGYELVWSCDQVMWSSPVKSEVFAFLDVQIRKNICKCKYKFLKFIKKYVSIQGQKCSLYPIFIIINIKSK